MREVNIVFHLVTIAMGEVNIALCEVNIAVLTGSTSRCAVRHGDVDLTRYQQGARSSSNDDGGVWWVQERGR